MRKHLETLGQLAHTTFFKSDPAITTLTLEGGVTIRALSSRPQSLRGLEGNLTLDEFAWCPQSQELWRAARAITDPVLGNPRGYKLRVISTPAGDDPDNVFYRLATRSDDVFSVHKTTIYDAVTEGFPANPDDIRAECIDDEEFNQEYNCSFLAASQRYISADLYDRAVYHDGYSPDFHGSPIYGGMDIARKRDRSAIELGALVGDTLWNYHGEDRRDVPWDEQERWAQQVLMRDGFARFCVDATGIGHMFAERLQKQFPSIVEPVTFSIKANEQLATGLKLAYARGKIRVRDDLDLRRDVLNLRRTTTAAGNVRYEAPREKGRHADKAWAQALMVHALGGFAKDHSTDWRLYSTKRDDRAMGW